MNLQHVRFPGPLLELMAAGADAVRQVPPAFPLTATVAVNPYLGQTGMDRADAALLLARTSGARLARPRTELRAMIGDGRIMPEELARAAANLGMTPEKLRIAADAPAASVAPLPTIADLAREADGIDWPDFLTQRIGLWAASHYDRGQAFWPAHEAPPFAAWRAFASRDLSPGLFGLPGIATHAASLSDDPRIAFAMACEALELPPEAGPLYFHRLLMTLEGWAQFARGRVWLAERDGETSGDAFAFLVIRLTWEAMLLRARPDLSAAWASARAAYADPPAPGRDLAVDLALQEAADCSAEARLAATFDAPPPRPARETRPAIQAAFCIDVRSETFRRAMETADPDVQTIGFAGFFGLAVAHRPAASDLTEARGPILLSPGAQARSTRGETAEIAARIRARTVRAWGRFKMATVSAFAFVEAAGPIYVGKLIRDGLGLGADAPPPPPPHLDLDPPGRVAAAAAILRAMSLTDGFAPLVLIAGHGAHVTNAPFASALQCGACGGHAGDVNARLLAGLLNNAQVRAGLRDEGIAIPDETRFVAGLHDTVSDEVTLFDAPPDADLTRLRGLLGRAAILARTERARRLPRARNPESLSARGRDWAEIRPEWGLAGCHAFIAAPRAATSGRDLGGRVFLHEYDRHADRDDATLTTILTAPVVVASWIALQYHGSALSPDQFGAGDKLLHNVTGGIGVIEGSAGHLRAGLPWQSVHDGEALRHEPERLMVAIAAPTDAISGVLDAHPQVRDLFDNGWLSLAALDDAGKVVARYERGTWLARAPRALAA
ncbi:hypothetical protein JSE7799_02745 [Jannaschia seosinensis]|uniref:Probable inorganic carbon transporter subunit DabA n=1 Tax=Jannaschia seosinensis TaxID=313367 RepID=A0A0M7BFB4_9RHOB|nr:DUF2309 domain-containing protein [Jannaschia seosinensis]CUH40016.1 hypothetical protein JSE7799_02745 [Jannaschia seosinensis]